MALPTVAIVGRPNVGKSTLFNAVVGRRQAIVSDIAGTTRDSVVQRVNGERHNYLLVDTAGLTNAKGDTLEMSMQEQALTALEHADVLMLVLDAKALLTQDDRSVTDKIRRTKKPVVVVANKIDDGDAMRAMDLAELGLGLPLAVSGKNFVRIWELQDAIEAALDEAPYEKTEEIEAPEGAIKLAFVGRPNVGKSTLLNTLLQENRAIVSPVSGTTRDRMDVPYTDKDGNPFVFIDTAGLRRKGKVGRSLEFWSTVRTREAIAEADICAILIDAVEGVTHLDLTLIGEVISAGKGALLCVNKFDLVKKLTRVEDIEEGVTIGIDFAGKDMNQARKDYWYYLNQKIGFAPWMPVHFFSAKNGSGLEDILETVKNIQKERTHRVPTAELNRLVPDIVYGHVAPSVGNKLGKIKYLSQVDTLPPKFIFFVNNVDAFHWSYRRYCENKLRDAYGFAGTPLQIEFRDAKRYTDERPDGRKKRR